MNSYEPMSRPKRNTTAFGFGIVLGIMTVGATFYAFFFFREKIVYFLKSTTVLPGAGLLILVFFFFKRSRRLRVSGFPIPPSIRDIQRGFHTATNQPVRLFTAILLSFSYIVGIGPVSLILKRMNRPVLTLEGDKKQKSYWTASHLGEEKEETYTYMS